MEIVHGPDQVDGAGLIRCIGQRTPYIFNLNELAAHGLPNFAGFLSEFGIVRVHLSQAISGCKLQSVRFEAEDDFLLIENIPYQKSNIFSRHDRDGESLIEDPDTIGKLTRVFETFEEFLAILEP